MVNQASVLNSQLEQQRQLTARLQQQFAAALRAAGPQGALRRAARGLLPVAVIGMALFTGYLASRTLLSRWRPRH